PIPPMQATAVAVGLERPEPPPPPPKDLVLAARVSDPPRVFRELLAFAPPGIASNIPGPEAVLELALGTKLADAVDLGQPIDIASVGDDSGSLVVSFAVKGDAEGRLAERV